MMAALPRLTVVVVVLRGNYSCFCCRSLRALSARKKGNNNSNIDEEKQRQGAGAAKQQPPITVAKAVTVQLPWREQAEEYTKIINLY